MDSRFVQYVYCNRGGSIKGTAVSLRLPQDLKIRLEIKFMGQRVAELENPRSIGEALAGSTLGNYWRYREARAKLD
jgi:hypothetical protein